MSDIRKRLAHVRDVMRRQPVWPPWSTPRRDSVPARKLTQGEIAALGRLGTDMAIATERAKVYFGVEEDQFGEDDLLLGLLALTLFGDYRKGRPKGTKTWEVQNHIDLACACHQLQKSGMSAAEACRRLGKGGDKDSPFRDFD